MSVMQCVKYISTSKFGISAHQVASKKVENKKSTSEKVTENTNKKFDSADKE